MIIEVLPLAFSVCKVSHLPAVISFAPFTFTGVTDSECSLVCPTHQVPDNTIAREDGWRAFRIAGSMEFSLVGILAGISSLLADNGISIFAISTFDTDYVLLKADSLALAVSVLCASGYEVHTLL